MKRLVPSAINKHILAYATALGSGNIDRLKEVYPAMSGAQERAWNEGFFKIAEKITVKPVEYRRPKISATTAVIDFTVPLNYTLQSSQTPTGRNFEFRATFDKQGTAWLLKSILTTR